MRTTYTYAVLEVSRAAYEEIAAKLRAAGYDHAFHQDSAYGTVIDMHGIAVSGPPAPVESQNCGADEWNAKVDAVLDGVASTKEHA